MADKNIGTKKLCPAKAKWPKNVQKLMSFAIARMFKGASARVLHKNYQDRLNKWLWGDSLWTSGYFYRYVGAVTNEAMQKYVTESQSKHWTTTISNQPQTTLLDYN